MILIPVTLYSQDSTFGNFNNSFGLKASNISGYGFYYNRKLNDDYKIQAMGLIYYLFSDNNNEKHTNFNYDIGLEIQRNIFYTTNTRVYILAGGFYYFDDDLVENPTNKTKMVNHSFNFGVGIAGEYYYYRFVLSIDLGYKFFEDRIVITENDNYSHPELYRVTKIGGGIGIGFMF